MTKLWVNGRASEDRDECKEEVRAHCEQCHDDKIETSKVQAERVRYPRGRGDSLIALQGRRIQITIDRVLRARGKMMRNKANGPAGCLVTEMLQVLPMETVRGHARFRDTVQRGFPGPRGVENSTPVFSQKKKN